MLVKVEKLVAGQSVVVREEEMEFINEVVAVTPWQNGKIELTVTDGDEWIRYWYAAGTELQVVS